MHLPSVGWGQARWGEGKWGGVEQVIITTKDGQAGALIGPAERLRCAAAAADQRVLVVDPRGPSAVGGAPLFTPRYAVPSRTLPPAGFIPPCLLEGALNEGGQALIGNAELKRTHIIVDGGCNSACTLVLGNADVCSTDRGFFYFHAALKDDAPSPEGTAYLMSVYPQEVKDWIWRAAG